MHPRGPGERLVCIEPPIRGVPCFLLDDPSAPEVANEGIETRRLLQELEGRRIESIRCLPRSEVTHIWENDESPRFGDDGRGMVPSVMVPFADTAQHR